MGELKVLNRTPATDDASRDVIEVLETALVRARKGELKGIVLIEKAVSESNYVTSGVDNRWELIGYLNYCIHCLLKL